MEHRKVVRRVVNALMVVCLLALSVDGLAAEGGKKKPKQPKQAKEMTVVGVVAAEKDGDEIKGVTLTAKRKDKEVVVNVTLDEKGTQLGEEMDGKKAMVKGTIQTKDGAKWITVSEFRGPKAKKPKKEK